MRKILSLVLTLTMLATLFVGFAVPANAAVVEGTAKISITPDVTSILGAEGTAKIIYTITITPPEGKELGAFSFELKAPEGMTLATNKLLAAVANKGGEGYWLNTKELKYAENEDTGEITGIFKKLAIV